MQALHHQIGAEPYRTFRLPRRESEVRAMSAVHNQHGARLMHSFPNGFHIGNHSVIGGRCDQNRLDIRIPLKHFFHLLRRDGIRHASLQKLWIEKYRLKLPQTEGMIDRLMTVPRHKDSSALPGRSGYCRQNPGRRAVHQKKGLVCAKNLSGPLLGQMQNPLRLMQVVEAVDLRDIQLRSSLQNLSGLRRHVSLMPRHVKGIISGIPVKLQLPYETAVRFSQPIFFITAHEFFRTFLHLPFLRRRVSRREQYLSAAVTIHASRHMGGTTVSGHMCFRIISRSQGVRL